MFSDTEREIYFKHNYQSVKVRAEMILLAASASESAFLDVLKEYIGLEGVTKAEKHAMTCLINEAIEEQKGVVIDQLLTASPSEISEVHSALVDSATMADEKREDEAYREALFREFGEKESKK